MKVSRFKERRKGKGRQRQMDIGNTGMVHRGGDRQEAHWRALLPS